MPEFVVLIPAYNEYSSLKKILEKIYRKYPIVIINDCSEDNTKNLKKDFKNLKILNNIKRLGYEHNLIKGINYILKQKYKYVVTFDADGEHHIDNLKKVKSLVKKNNDCDMFIGERSLLNRVSERIISISFYFKFNIKDPLSGFKIYKTSSLKELNKFKNNNLFLVDLVFMFIKMQKKIKNFKIKSVNIKRRQSKVGSFFYANFKILKCLKFIVKN